MFTKSFASISLPNYVRSLEGCQELLLPIATKGLKAQSTKALHINEVRPFKVAMARPKPGTYMLLSTRNVGTDLKGYAYQILGIAS